MRLRRIPHSSPQLNVCWKLLAKPLGRSALWLNITLALAGAAAGVERALTLRRNRLLDLETWWTGI